MLSACPLPCPGMGGKKPEGPDAPKKKSGGCPSMPGTDCTGCPCGPTDMLNPIGLMPKLTEWNKAHGSRDLYIGGEIPKPWNARNICFMSKCIPGLSFIPFKVHVRAPPGCPCCKICCDICCDCNCCPCPGCAFFPEQFRCCHCTCGKFPTFCHPVVV